MKKETKAPKEQEAPTYISNPFKLAFRATAQLFEKNAGWAIVIAVLTMFGSFGSPPASNGNGGNGPIEGGLSTTDPTNTFALVIFIVCGVLLLVALAVIIGTFVQGLFSYAVLQSQKGVSVGFKEAYRAVKNRFARLLSAQLLVILKVLGWSLLFIIPGIITAIRYSLLSYVIMDESEEERSVKGAHDRTKILVKGRLWELFGVSTTSIVPIIGGVFETAGNGALYRQLQVYTDQNLEKPKIHWLNYLMLVLLLVFLVGLLLLAALLSKVLTI